MVIAYLDARYVSSNQYNSSYLDKSNFVVISERNDAWLVFVYFGGESKICQVRLEVAIVANG